MTQPRDLGQLIEAFLDEGPAVLPDRVLDAIGHDVHSTRQRRNGSWRYRAMPRTVLAVAAVVAVGVVAVVGISLIQPPRSEVGGSAASHAPTTAPAPNASGFPAVIASVPIGETYHARDFGEPFSFVMPNLSFGGSGLEDVTEWAAEPRSRAFSIRRPGSDLPHVDVTFLDDAQLPADLCSALGILPDIPASPQAVQEWLYAPGDLVMNPPRRMSVDGRAAISFEVVLGSDCYPSIDPPPAGPSVWFRSGQYVQLGAISTGDDTILMLATLAPAGRPEDELLDDLHRATESLLSSIQFGD